MYTVNDIAAILNTQPTSGGDSIVEILLTDSRRLIIPETTLFFTIQGPVQSANKHVKSLYDQGVKSFVVDKTFQDAAQCPDASFIFVDDTLLALQKVATAHRNKFTLPVIGITGSNGKTIVKEWLDFLLNDSFQVVKSPKSYNSQVGVPLSIWQITATHTLGVFEAGISEMNEMERLNAVIRPDICVVTSIGESHALGFSSLAVKIDEKLKLCKDASLLIYGANDNLLHQRVDAFKAIHPNLKTINWGNDPSFDVYVEDVQVMDNSTAIKIVSNNISHSYTIPFVDRASISNAVTCICVLKHLQIPVEFIKERLHHLPTVEMRLEMMQGINNCSVINDSYVNDLTSLGVALDNLEKQNQHTKRTVILSDMFQLRKDKETTYRYVAALINKRNITKLIGVGPDISAHKELFKVPDAQFYNSTNDLIIDLPNLSFQNEIILVKGARTFEFEKIVALLEFQTHDAVFEINLNALKHNLRFFQQKLQRTKLMAMVKAFSYGTGSFEIANILQHAKVDYLAVAYPDEGVELRSAGVTLPIMVMNTEEAGFKNIVKYSLEPEIYSLRLAKIFISYLESRSIQAYPVHLKLDTGMHRLGFEKQDLNQLFAVLKNTASIKIQSVFTHLAGSDDETFDAFTNEQSSLFVEMCNDIESAIGYSFIRHISNSAAITRHSDLNFDMARLGIGLYGLDPDPNISKKLMQVGTLRTTISQIRNVKTGDTVGYNRQGKVEKDSVIATIRIGYADGYPRSLGNGKGSVWVNGELAPVIGNVCMDMTMIDVTGINAKEGDSVILFGPQLSVATVAKNANTIAYEILTGISQRIKRVYYDE